MNLSRYCKVKRGIVYYQRRVPADVRGIAPFSSMPVVFEKSLKTADITQAHRAIAETNEWFERHLAAARSGSPFIEKPQPQRGIVVPPTVNVPWAQYHARKHYEQLVETSRSLRRATGKRIPEAKGLLALWIEEVIAPLNGDIERLRERNLQAVRSIALEIFVSEGLAPPPSSEGSSPADWQSRYAVADTLGFEMLSEALIDARLDAIEALRNESLGGLAKYEPKSVTLREAPSRLEDASKYELEDVTRRLVAESDTKGDDWHSRLLRAAEIWRQFELPGDVRNITRAHVADYVTKLTKAPANIAQRFPGMTWPEALIANLQADHSRLSPNTVKDGFLAPLKRIFSYAEDQELIASNPAHLVKVAGVDTSRRGTGFEIAELNTMLQLPLFVGCHSAKSRLKQGSLIIDDHWFWAPLVALFTGARTSEIAQIELAEVSFAPTPFIRIQADDERRLKTKNARRSVPIHRHLLSIGFASYVERLKKKNEKRLFPDWLAPEGDSYADAPSQRNFKRYVIPLISNQTSPHPNFHSFRHTMKMQMSRSGIPDQHQNAILGHTQQGMSRVYMGAIPIEALADSMNRIDFGGLEIEHLFGTRADPSSAGADITPRNTRAA